MSSIFEDLKLLHPYLSGWESSTWKEKLVDSTTSPDEWSAHAKDFLREIGGADYHSLPVLAETGSATPDGVFGSAIIEYVRHALISFNLNSLKFSLVGYLDVEGLHKNHNQMR